jgi:hypothetical protein
MGDLNGSKDALDWTLAHQGDAGMWPGMIGALCDKIGLDPAHQWEGALLRNPGNDEARRLLAIRLVNTGREQEAVSHLDMLQRRGHAEGATLLAQLAENKGDIGRAEGWKKRAGQLAQ